jgi:hypothetical protein
MAVNYVNYALWKRETVGSFDDDDSEDNRQLRYWIKLSTPDRDRCAFRRVRFQLKAKPRLRRVSHWFWKSVGTAFTGRRGTCVSCEHPSIWV